MRLLYDNTLDQEMLEEYSSMQRIENTGLRLVVDTLLWYSLNISRVRYLTKNARDSFSNY